MSCPSETITLANSFVVDSTGNYVVKNYTTTKDSSGKNKTSCLPTSGTGNSAVSSFPRSSIDSTTGNVKDSAVSAHVNTWLSQNSGEAPAVLTPTDNDPVAAFSIKSESLRNAIRAEYCYYQNRYAYMINICFTNLASKSTNAIAEKQLPCVDQLNSMLNQILQVYQGLINSRNATIASYYTNAGMNVNSLNSDIDTSRTSLQKQSAILRNATLVTDVQSAMVEYSIEKNQSSRNLLIIYGFMNLAAVSLIFYLYRSTKIQ
jgi:hypothetical protein